MSLSLDKKIALVTGASRGIGRAIAIKLGQCGATVIGTATTEAGVNTMLDALKAEGIEGLGYCLDVCDLQQVQQLFETLKAQHTQPLILVNNAGITQDNLLLRMRAEQWNSVINTNLNAIFHTTKVSLKPMLKARWGRIINISSIVATIGNPGQANYCAAKAGMIGFTKAISHEVARAGITVNAVLPGVIDTRMTQELTHTQQDAFQEKIPMRRKGTAEEVAHAVAFLASDDAAYITGESLSVAGGLG